MKKTILALTTALVFIGCGGGGSGGNSTNYDINKSQDETSISTKRSIDMVGTWNLSITDDYDLCVRKTATAIVTVTRKNGVYHFYSRWQDKGMILTIYTPSSPPSDCYVMDVRNWDINTRKDWIVNEINYNNANNAISYDEMTKQDFKYALSYIEACDTSDISNITDLGVNIQSKTQFVHIIQHTVRNTNIIAKSTAVWTKQQ